MEDRNFGACQVAKRRWNLYQFVSGSGWHWLVRGLKLAAGYSPGASWHPEIAVLHPFTEKGSWCSEQNERQHRHEVKKDCDRFDASKIHCSITTIWLNSVGSQPFPTWYQDKPTANDPLLNTTFRYSYIYMDRRFSVSVLWRTCQGDGFDCTAGNSVWIPESLKMVWPICWQTTKDLNWNAGGCRGVMKILALRRPTWWFLMHFARTSAGPVERSCGVVPALTLAMVSWLVPSMQMKSNYYLLRCWIDFLFSTIRCHFWFYQW